ncbi:MAG: NAD(P)H-hydrate epimerase [Bacteroidales bacterium]|nr:NAD(P)H-hydrate epimerase [Bacteroidales bacterium]
MSSNLKPAVLSLEKFKEMDYQAVEKYQLPIELMMENAGLQLARLVSTCAKEKAKVLVGVGKGNNGGGGLVAARRLAGWGFRVFLHLPEKDLKPLPALQLSRALAFGVNPEPIPDPDIFVEAYLGFSQRLPLSAPVFEAVEKANHLQCLKISLDLPTGFDINTGESIFKPDIILTLAAMKKELLLPGVSAQLYVADLGIPASLYQNFGVQQPREFKVSGIFKFSGK